jgi:hypothetical protein
MEIAPAPTKDQIILTPGCGTTGNQANREVDGLNDFKYPGDRNSDKPYYMGFTCEPEHGCHICEYYKEVAPYLPASVQKLCSAKPKQATSDATDVSNFGFIPTEACYTVNPCRPCKPSYHGFFIDDALAQAIGAHKFDMVYFDHGMDPDDLDKVDIIRKTLERSLSFLNSNGLLYWNVFNGPRTYVDGKWVVDAQAGRDKEIWDAVKPELERVSNQGKWVELVVDLRPKEPETEAEKKKWEAEGWDKTGPPPITKPEQGCTGSFVAVLFTKN